MFVVLYFIKIVPKSIGWVPEYSHYGLLYHNFSNTSETNHILTSNTSENKLKLTQPVGYRRLLLLREGVL
jgi:hypothetical protein